MRETIRRYLPGVLLLVICGLISRVLADAIPHTNYIILATVMGLVIANSTDVSGWVRRGAETYELWLKTGIVLMGAQIAVGEMLDLGAVILLMVLFFLGFGLLYVETLARRFFETSEKLSSLLAVGSSVCGVSAIVAVSGVIKAREDEIAYAVATILLFDVVTLFVYPIVGQILSLPDTVFGVWAGISMFSTGPAVAAGYEYSGDAGRWAVLTKLARNSFLGIVVVLYAAYYTKRQTSKTATEWRIVWDSFPKFVIGFALFVLVANAGLLSDSQITSLENASNWLFLLAFVGLGLNIEFREIRKTGVVPVLVVFLSLLTLSTLSLVVAVLFLW